MFASLGTWKRLGSGRFTTTVEKYRFNGPMYIGKTVIHELQEPSADGSKYTGQATTTIVNNDGTRVHLPLHIDRPPRLAPSPRLVRARERGPPLLPQETSEGPGGRHRIAVRSTWRP